jgi:hypothetical protein
MMAIRINININGNKTKNQDIAGTPALHIKFKTHVQNKTYNTFIIKSNVKLDVLHE